MQNFWTTLSKPIFALAPMADVTDTAFRRIIASCGKPNVFFTEFVSADGLYHTREQQKLPDEQNPLMRDLLFSDGEHPIVAQLFSAHPDMLAYGAALAADMGFDGVDINMGCPDRSIEKQGAGAALMKDTARARTLIRAAKHGVRERIPVSVKTRIGYNTNELTTWLPELLAEEPAAITVHARSRKELSKVPARWEHVAEAVEIRDRVQGKDSTTLVLGNGDLTDLSDARTKAKETGADGAMLGRAIFGNPWLWSNRKREDILLSERLGVLSKHCTLFETLVTHKSFAVMKKHFKAYVTDFDGAKELRMGLMQCNDAACVTHTINQFLATTTEQH